jgi:gliding motility-associated protein GldC
MSDTPIISRYSQIRIKIGLDQTQTPAEIWWDADDAPEAQKPQECKAMLLALFDKEHRDTLKIDLWTNDFQVQEMDRMMFHTLRGLADTYLKATKNTELANNMQQFAQYFGEKTGILTPENK